MIEIPIWDAEHQLVVPRDRVTRSRRNDITGTVIAFTEYPDTVQVVWEDKTLPVRERGTQLLRVNPAEPGDPATHLEQVWRPSREQIVHAVGLINTARSLHIAPPVYKVVAPHVLPGKTYGVWDLGQVVEPVPGLWLAERNGEAGLYSYRAARDAAEDAGQKQLGDRPGTYGYANINSDGTWAVFEAIV